MGEQRWYVYVIETDKQALYTGISTDVARRFQEHLNVANGVPGSKGAKFFRLHRPVAIVYKQRFATRSAASKHEYLLKKMNRNEKIALCTGPSGSASAAQC